VFSSRRIGAVVALLSIGVLLVACGDEGSKKELSNGTASSLRNALDKVEQRVDERDCSGASQVAASFRSEVEGLSSSVGADLRRALAASADRLESLIADQCQSAVVQEPSVGTTSEDQATPPADENQQGNGKKDKKPKKEKPKPQEPAPGTGTTGQENQGVGQGQQNGGAAAPGD
jgi:hypothetical protein